MPFSKGKSGNPRGRPRKGESLTDLLREKLETTKTTRDKQPRKEKIAEKLIALAESGDLGALRYIFDRIDGRPKETVELENAALDAQLRGIMSNGN